MADACAVRSLTEFFSQDLRATAQVSPPTLILNKAFTVSSHRMAVLRIGKELLSFRKTFKGIKVQPLVQGHELPGDCLGVGTHSGVYANSLIPKPLDPF